jgi:hypothetical protein
MPEQSLHDQINRNIAHRISEGPRLSIERISTEDMDVSHDTGRISAHISSELQRHLYEMYDDTDASEALANPRDAIRFGSLLTRRQLEKHVTEHVSVGIGKTKALDFVVKNGSRIFGPPYDREWSEGNGIAFGGRLDGKAITTPKANGFSAAGIGFYLTTNEPVLAAITPQGTYNWSWSAFENLPFARSRGGMGIAIYTDGEPNPTMSRQPLLWSLSGMTAFSGQKDSGRIADAASPAFGFGTVPLAPALVHMVPGSRYLVWVWCWQTSQLESDDAFIAFLSFTMPFVTIDAGPPGSLH